LKGTPVGITAYLVVEILNATCRPRNHAGTVSLPSTLCGSSSKPGGLSSYATSLVEQFRRVASYVDKISRAPNQRHARRATHQFELVINLKTAKALGLTIPPSLLHNGGTR
jgi:putative ABC transport system substrate-binding protein